MKKFRLKINYSEITKKNFDIVSELRRYDNKIISYDKVDCYLESSDGYILDIPESWLTEITEDEPLSFADWFESETFENLDPEMSYQFDFIRRWASDSWKASIENYKISLTNDKEEQKENNET